MVLSTLKNIRGKVQDYVQDKAMDHLLRNTIIYNVAWEDPRVDGKVLKLGPEDRLLMLTTGGCNVMDRLLDGVAHIVSVDLNPSQNALLELRLAAARSCRDSVMAVEVQTSPHPSPWAWQDDASVFARGAGPISPTIRGHELDDQGSFLPVMQSFRLSGLDESPEPQPSSAEPVATANASAGGGPSAVAPASALPGPTPLVRQRSGAEHIEMFVEEAFDEMDAALAQQQAQRQEAAYFDARPSAEEQAWLDREYEEMMVEAPDEVEARAEEDEFVRRLLMQHPALEEEEARWLYARERNAREHANNGG